MSIKSYIDELEQLNNEIKRNNTNNRSLRARVLNVENNIKEYLDHKGQHGLKYNGKAIIMENTECRKRKKKKEKEDDVISLLMEFGIKDPKEAYKKIQETQKGIPIEQKKIKFKKLIKK